VHNALEAHKTLSDLKTIEKIIEEKKICKKLNMRYPKKLKNVRSQKQKQRTT